MTTRDEIRFALIQLMASKNVKGKDLAAYLGVTPQAVSMWRTGKGGIDIEKLPALCEFFGITINEFFAMISKNTKPPTLSISERKLIEYYRHVPKHCQRAILMNAKLMTETENEDTSVSDLDDLLSND